MTLLYQEEEKMARLLTKFDRIEINKLLHDYTAKGIKWVDGFWNLLKEGIDSSNIMKF
jgi:hypothetical protein